MRQGESYALNGYDMLPVVVYLYVAASSPEAAMAEALAGFVHDTPAEAAAWLTDGDKVWSVTFAPVPESATEIPGQGFPD